QAHYSYILARDATTKFPNRQCFPWRSISHPYFPRAIDANRGNGTPVIDPFFELLAKYSNFRQSIRRDRGQDRLPRRTFERNAERVGQDLEHANWRACRSPFLSVAPGIQTRRGHLLDYPG